MTNVAGKAYAMNVATPIPPGMSWLTRFVFMVTRAFKDSLAPLLGLGLIHFARWVIVRRDQWPELGQPKSHLTHDYMLFASNFNGTWDQYVDAFSDTLPAGLNLIWQTSVRFPQSIPVTPFKNYIRANQIDTNYYYNATPGSGQRDIKCALRLANDLRQAATQLHTLDDEALGKLYARILRDNQGGLGSAGYAPVPSVATMEADRNRARAERDLRKAGALTAARQLHPVPAATVHASAANADVVQRIEVGAAVDEVLGTQSRVDEAPPLEREKAGAGGDDA